MQGDECPYSHDALPPLKMELCKFYLMECCAKRDKCLYMHSEFPCKFYHTGLKCYAKDDCKFAHGKPLNDNLKQILLKVSHKREQIDCACLAFVLIPGNTLLDNSFGGSHS